MTRSIESAYLDPHHLGESDEDFTTGFEATSLDRPRPGDSQRVVDGLVDLLERRINIIMGKAGPNWRRFVGPVYDPTKGGAGDGVTCTKCRKVSPTNARVCWSCGTIL